VFEIIGARRTDVDLDALREEIVASIHTQHACFALGVGATGVVAAEGFHAWGDRASLAELIFLLIVPAVAFTTTAIWISEVARMFRAGQHVVDVEQEINAEVSQDRGPAMRWETELWNVERKPYCRVLDGQAIGQYVSMLAGLVGVVALSIVLGEWRYWEEAHAEAWSIVQSVVVALGSVVSIGALGYLWRTSVSRFTLTEKAAAKRSPGTTRGARPETSASVGAVIGSSATNRFPGGA
jgi:hypothetical protein